MKERIDKLEHRVSRLSNIAWVLGTLAVIFGVSGGFGLKLMINAKTEISNLQDDIKIVQDDIKKTEIFLDDVLDKKKGELDKHADSLGLKLITDLKGGLPDLIATDNCIDYQWDFRNKAGKGHWWTCPDGRVMIGFQYGSGTNPPSSWEPILKCCRLDFRKQG